MNITLSTEHYILAISVGVILLVDWLIYNQLEKNNETESFVIYLVLLMLLVVLNKQFELVKILCTIGLAVFLHLLNIFCYKRCFGTFKSFIMTKIIWEIIICMVIFVVWIALYVHSNGMLPELEFLYA